jgi:hypothetical protein
MGILSLEPHGIILATHTYYSILTRIRSWRSRV